MFLQPPEELAGPVWSDKIAPSFCSHAPDRRRTRAEQQERPGFLIQARCAAERHPDSPIALARLAQAAQIHGNFDEAVNTARRALDLGLDSSEPGAVHAAIAVLTASGQMRDLASMIDDPRAESMPVAVRMHAAAAAHEFDAAGRLARIDTSADALTLLAWIRCEQRDFSGAIAAGRQAERAGAAGVVLYANVGYAHAAIGNLDKAVKLTRQALALSPLDRRVALNLVHYLQLAGRVDDALDQLEMMRSTDRLDIELALATARTLVAADRWSDAHRVLQRVRASQEWATADDISRAELTANLTLLRWMTRRDRADSTLREIIRALEACDYRSLAIAGLLMNLMRTPAHAPALERVIGRMEPRHAERDLYGLRTLLAVLRRDPDAAVRYARAWVAHSLFSPFAAATAILLIGEVGGDFRAAADIGVASMRRLPSTVMLRNNTAFCLALAGDTTRARALLDRRDGSGEEDVYMTATRALIIALDGDVEKGRNGYRCAKALADQRGDKSLAARVELYGALAEHAAGETPVLGDPRELFAQLPKAWREEPEFWIAGEHIRQRVTVLS